MASLGVIQSVCCKSHTIESCVLPVYHHGLSLHISLCRIIINNTNDAPAISLDGVEDPVNQQFSANYTEGTGAQRIVSDLLVVDTDPNSMIRRYSLSFYS